MTRRLLTITPDALGDATFSRAGSATYVDATGVLQTAAADVVRDAHYEQGVRTILLEGAGTNGWTPRDGSAWNVEATTKTTNALTAPDGTMTATQYLETAVNGSTFDCYRIAPGTPPDNTTQAPSVFAKPIGRRYLQFRLRPKSGPAGDLFAVFDTQAGALARIDAGVTATASATLSQNWRRFAFAFNSGSGAQTPLAAVTARDSATPWSSTNGDVTKGYALWGDQWEVNQAFCSSFMPTASRSPDLIGWTIPDAPHAMEWRGSFFEHGQATAPSAQRGAVAYLGNDAATGAYLLVDPNGGGYNFRHHNGTTLVASPAVATIPIEARVDWRAVLYPDGSVEMFLSVAGAAEISGGRSAANPFAAAWGGQTFRLNSKGTGFQGNAAYISATVTDTSIHHPSITFTDGAGTVTITAQGLTLNNWTPDVEDVGPRETALGTGVMHQFILRTDYVASFEMANIPASALGDLIRLKRHLTNGGTITIATADRQLRTYTATLRPGTVPTWTFADRVNLEYTLSLSCRNSAAAPMLCDYAP